VAGGQADAEHLLGKATRTVATAGEIARDDPDSADVLAYAVARYAGTALLAHQGLRPTTCGASDQACNVVATFVDVPSGHESKTTTSRDAT